MTEEILQPGLLAVVMGEVSIQSVLLMAASDMCFVIAAIALVALASAALEQLFKVILGQFISEGAIWFLEGRLTYLGVAYHELSHALFAWITGGKVTDINLRRRDMPDGSAVLGSVTFVPSALPVLAAIQAVACGIAPAVMGLIGMTCIALFAFPTCTQWWQWVIWIYLFACLLLHSDLSPQDIRSATPGIPILAVLLFAICIIFPFDPVALLHTLVGIGSDPAVVSELVDGSNGISEDLSRPSGVEVNPDMYA